MSTRTEQAAGTATRTAIVASTTSDTMSTFTVMVIRFMLEELLALDVVGVFFFFLALVLDQVANSIVIDH
jgi:hypothetical protein